MLNKKKLDPNWVEYKDEYDGVVFHTTAYEADNILYMVMRCRDEYLIGRYPYDDANKSVGRYKIKALEEFFKKRKIWTVVKRVSPLTDPEYLKYEKS